MVERLAYPHKTRIMLTDTRVYTFGVDLGPNILLLEKKNNVVLCKAPGHSTWVGIGGYCPTYYYIIELEQKDDMLLGLITYEFKSGRNWRQVLAEAKKTFEEVADGKD